MARCLIYRDTIIYPWTIIYPDGIDCPNPDPGANAWYPIMPRAKYDIGIYKKTVND